MPVNIGLENCRFYNVKCVFSIFTPFPYHLQTTFSICNTSTDKSTSFYFESCIFYNPEEPKHFLLRNSIRYNNSLTHRTPRNASEQFKWKRCEKWKSSEEYVYNLESTLCFTFVFHIGFEQGKRKSNEKIQQMWKWIISRAIYFLCDSVLPILGEFSYNKIWMV